MCRLRNGGHFVWPQCVKQGNRVVLQYTPMLCFWSVSYSFYLNPLLLLPWMFRCILWIWWVAKIYFVIHFTFQVISMHPLKHGQTNHMNPLRIISFDFLLCGYLRFDYILWNVLYFAIINCHQLWCNTPYTSRCHYRLNHTRNHSSRFRATFNVSLCHSVCG